MRRFLLINPFGIGDLLFTTPLLTAIKEEYPDSFIGYWCNERVISLLKDCPQVDTIFALSRGDLKRLYRKNPFLAVGRFFGLLRNIKRGRFELAFDFSLDHRYNLISKLLGIKHRIGFNYKNRGRFLTEKIELDGYEGRHVAEYYLDLLQYLKVKPREKKLSLAVSQQDKLKAAELLSGLGIKDSDIIIGIAAGAGASWGKDAHLKHWPQEKFASLADRLSKEFNAKILILGDESERRIADNLISAMNNQAIDLVGKTSLAEYIALIEKLDCLVTNDGGPMHLAVALGVNTVSIFGPVDPKVYGPYPLDSQHHIVLTKDLACRPCYQKFRMPECRNNRECLEKIEVEEVIQAVSGLIRR